LRELTPEIAAKPAHLFSIRPAHGRHLLPGWEDSLGKGWFSGENPPEGALLTVWIREFSGEKFTLTMKNAAGQPVARFEQVATPGLTRLNWNLRLSEAYRTKYGGDSADRFVPPGDYTAELAHAGVIAKQAFKVTVAPGLPTHGTFKE